MAIRENPMFKQLLEAGEAQLNRLAAQLLANEKFVQTLQSAVARTLSAKGSLDKSLRGALATMNLPSTADVEELRDRLDGLDRTMTELDAKLSRLEQKLGRAPRAEAPAAKRTRKPAARKKKTEA